MLTKVSGTNLSLSTSQIKQFVCKYGSELMLSKQIDKIQDNLNGWLLIKYTNGLIQMYNYVIDKFYSHNLIQITGLYDEQIKILKHIDSFDQNNSLVANKLRQWVIKKIKLINITKHPVKKILGIGGEYYLYWKLLESNMIDFPIGISNCKSIISDAKLNIPWSSNYLVDYNDLTTYPELTDFDLILINLSNLNINVIKYIKKINWKTIIFISCNLTDKKFKLLVNEFKIKTIKYFKNFDNVIKIIEFNKKFFNKL